LPETLQQIQAFVLTLVLGLASGLVLNYYQIIIRHTKLKAAVLYIFDLLLWIFIILLVFAAMLWINQGEIRFYILLALLIGIIIYFRKLAQYLDSYLLEAALKTIRAGAFIWHGLAAVVKKISAVCGGLGKKNNDPPLNPDD